MKKALCVLLIVGGAVRAQVLEPPFAMVQSSGASGQSGAPGASLSSTQGAATQAPPVTLTLKDTLEMAQKNEPQFLSSLTDARVAREDTRQARAAKYPSFGLKSEFINSQGNGITPTGRFVTNDGIHVYREWATMHQDLSPGTLTGTGYRRATAAEAVAQAKVEIARRGLTVTVTKAYYTLLVAQRKYATAQQALVEAQRAANISQNLERGGEVAHSDVVKAQLQQNVQMQVLREAQLTMGNARLELAVLLFRDFDQNFQIVDDLNLAAALPPLADVQAMAAKANPGLGVAMYTLRSAETDVKIARQAFWPTLTLDVAYGIEANAILLRSTYVADRASGPVPTLGYSLDATLTFPVWDWGARKSKLHQAEFKRTQTSIELSATQRQMIKNLEAAYQEAQTARDQRDLLRQAADLASENLRLNNLRYQAGEATVLERVDAQNSLVQARNSLDDGEVRYRVAIANVQTLTGDF
jgi:outer membrane protein TolC